MRSLLVSLLIATAFVSGCGSTAKHAAGDPCRASDLKSSVSLQGATGSLLGGETVRNTSSRTCALGGRPSLQLLRADGRRVALRVHLGDRVFPTGRRVTVLRPGRAASVWIRWVDYCGSLSDRAFTFRLTLTAGAVVSARTSPNLGVKCQENGGAPSPGPGTGEVSLSTFVAPVR
ncbi:MAG: DUF4232 domain-containing protein [Gaiellaceae bacterium]